MFVAVFSDGGQVFLEPVVIDLELFGENLDGLAGNGQYLVAEAGAYVVNCLAKVID